MEFSHNHNQWWKCISSRIIWWLRGVVYCSPGWFEEWWYPGNVLLIINLHLFGTKQAAHYFFKISRHVFKKWHNASQRLIHGCIFLKKMMHWFSCGMGWWYHNTRQTRLDGKNQMGTEKDIKIQAWRAFYWIHCKQDHNGIHQWQAGLSQVPAIIIYV